MVEDGKTPNEACLNAEIVFMCVGRDEGYY